MGAAALHHHAARWTTGPQRPSMRRTDMHGTRCAETAAPAPDVRVAKFTIGDPARVAGHFPDAPMAPASLLVGHGFETIGLFADADARLAAGYTVLSYKGGCERTPWLNEQAIITTTRTGDTSFHVAMTGAVGGNVLAFDVAVALHA